MIIVQYIQTSWSKVSRGHSAARLRNAVPEALSLPKQAADKPADKLIEHTSSFNEEDDFSSPHVSLTEEAVGAIRIGCVGIEPQTNALRVTYEYDSRIGGMPLRRSYRGEPTKTSFDLCFNHWGRVKYNGRFSHDEGWWYQKVVLNIGWFDVVSQDVFVSTSPAHTIDQMATLR